MVEGEEGVLGVGGWGVHRERERDILAEDIIRVSGSCR